MAFPLLLLAAQAGGIALDMYQRRKQERFSNIGGEMERQELQLQIEKEGLASSEEALANTERLRETMATQRAIFAARGQKSSQGSAQAIGQRQIRTFEADERARQISLSFRKHQLESHQRLLGINKAARRSERRTKDFMGVLNLMNFNSMGGASKSKLNTRGAKLDDTLF